MDNLGNSFKLSEEQLKTYNTIENTDDNYFITGKAGTGKSVLLKYFINNTHKNVAVVAPTGIAAININGQTIHSFFGLKPSLQNPYEAGKITEQKKKLLKSIDTLIVDEISMVRSDIMDMIDLKLRIARNCPNEPFGGCQIVVFGDLFQLSPVMDKDEIAQKYIYDNFGSEFFFATSGVQEKPFKIIELDDVYRQTEETFIKILNEIRVGQLSSDTLTTINKRQKDVPNNSNYITLTPTRAAADLVNKENLNRLTTEKYTYVGEVTGDFTENEIPTDMELKLKVGAQVIMLKNDTAKRWINGTIGIVSELSTNYIKVKINGINYSVNREVWTKYQYVYDEELKTIKQEEIGTFKQFPIQLAYAITIHKSQGQTYEQVLVDYSVGGAFATGQTYVALSRCKRMDGLYLSEKLIPDDIRVNQEIINYFDGNFHHEFNKIPIEEIKAQSKKKNVGIKWLAGDSIQVENTANPKKLTGTRFPAILGFDKYKNPFTVWCAMMHVFEEEFTGNKFTDAGKIIEPKQIEYIKSIYSSGINSILSPDDKYGNNAKENMGYDFFRENEVFGGMWDAVLQDSNETKAVFELKTVSAKKRTEWNMEIPKTNKLQAALYAWLLGVDDIYIIVSFLEGKDYDSPSSFRCNQYNTSTFKIKLSQEYPNFESEYIRPALKWWNKYIETGISPKFDKIADKKIIDNIKN